MWKTYSDISYRIFANKVTILENIFQSHVTPCMHVCIRVSLSRMYTCGKAPNTGANQYSVHPRIGDRVNLSRPHITPSQRPRRLLDHRVEGGGNLFSSPFDPVLPLSPSLREQNNEGSRIFTSGETKFFNIRL